MKNIHILKTNPQHIYITSDEVKKNGECVLSKLNEVVKFCSLYCQNEYKKIILTTDQDLIKDGVQAIDDEFLEWFVKNPSCERVEVKDVYFNGSGYYDDNQLSEQEKVLYSSMKEYKIIIPKEEPKQICDNCKIEISKYGCGCGKQEEPKPVWKQIIETCGGEEEFMKSAGLLSQQGTLEEAVKNHYYRKLHISEEQYDLFDYAFAEGAKWQAKRMYSEEDVIEFDKWKSSLISTKKEDYPLYMLPTDPTRWLTTKELLQIWKELNFVNDRLPDLYSRFNPSSFYTHLSREVLNKWLE